MAAKIDRRRYGTKLRQCHPMYTGLWRVAAQGGTCVCSTAVMWQQSRSLQGLLWHGRPHIGTNGVSCIPSWKMDEKLKSENMQKRAVFYVYVIF